MLCEGEKIPLPPRFSRDDALEVPSQLGTETKVPERASWLMQVKNRSKRQSYGARRGTMVSALNMLRSVRCLGRTSGAFKSRPTSMRRLRNERKRCRLRGDLRTEFDRTDCGKRSQTPKSNAASMMSPAKRNDPINASSWASFAQRRFREKHFCKLS